MKKGFTLIELMVVMAIIAILSTTVFIALSSVRNRGSDTAVKASMTSLMSLSQLYYEEGDTSTANSYTSFCTAAKAGVSAATQNKINAAIAKIEVENGTNIVSCTANSTAWALTTVLKGGNSQCVDSELNNVGRTTAYGAGITVCP